MKPFFLLITLAVSTLAGTLEPVEVAVDFLTKVRSGKINLEPGGDTALSANTEAAKRGEITRRLERTASDLEAGTFEPGATRIDDDLAAVLVHKIGGFDPNRLRVFAVALVRKGETWLPAPVLASFENTGLGFAPGLRQRARNLENWMLDQQLSELDLLRQQANARMRSEILASISVEELRELPPEAVGRRFIEACAKPHLPTMLGLLGGLQTVLPDDWAIRLKAADAAVASPQSTNRPWRLLVAPDILRTVVHEEATATTATLSVACLDPTQFPGNSSQPGIEFVHLQLSKSPDGLWQVDPPAPFLLAEPSESAADPDEDSDLLDKYPAVLRKDHPLQPQATVADAIAALQSALVNPSPAPLITLLGLDGSVKTARLGVTRAISAWGALHNPAVVRCPVLLGTFENDSVAAASFQFFSVRRDSLDLRVFYFERKNDAWRLLTGLTPSTRSQARFLGATTWADTQPKRWADNWREKLLANSTHLAAIPAADAPSEDDARKLISSWLDVIRAGTIPEAIALTTWLDPATSPARVLRNLGFEINSARKAKTQAVITAVVRGKSWTTVTVRTNPGDNSSFPVYPVVTTPAGPKLLLEVDLFASSERGRQFLNAAAIDHLRDFTPPEIVAELQELFKKPTPATAP